MKWREWLSVPTLSSWVRVAETGTAAREHLLRAATAFGGKAHVTMCAHQMVERDGSPLHADEDL